MKVLCIDDSNRPEEVPLSSWVTKGSEYTIINSFTGLNGIEIVEISEIDIKKASGGIYKGFKASRFSHPNTNLIKSVIKKELAI
jgi:hypothetical protein